MISPNDVLPYLNLVSLVLAICVVIGGFSGFRNGRQAKLAQLQKDTNDALQQRIETLESKIADFEKENTVQRYILDTLTTALKQRGLIITINGDMVTIQDAKGTTTHRKRTSTTQQSAGITKKEEV